MKLTAKTQRTQIDKNSLFDGVSIGIIKLVCQEKTTTRCKTISCSSFERKLREGDQEEDNEKFKTDEVFLCKPWLRSGRLLLFSLWPFLHIRFKGVIGIAIVIIPG